MTINIQAKNAENDTLEMPNGFWPAFCVETPAAEVLKCRYKAPDRLIIVYEHDGYVGDLISREEALAIHALLIEFVKTNNYDTHRYFGTRKNQMESMIEFLPTCNGFRLEN